MRHLDRVIQSVALAVGLLAAASNSWGAYTETFSYPDGPLEGNDNWVGQGNVPLDIAVASETLKITGGASTDPDGNQWAWNESINETGDGVTVTVKIMAGAAGPGGDGNIWYLYLGNQDFAYTLGYWYGGSANAQSRQGNDVVNNVLSGPGVWDELKAVIDFAAGTTDFYFNGVKNHTVHHTAPSTAVQLVEFNRVERSDLTGTYVFFDDLAVDPPPCFATITPTDGQASGAAIGGPAYPPSHTYTILNNHADPFSYTVVETDANGAPTDHTWLSLDKNSGPVLANGASDTVVASIDATGLAAGVYRGYLKFTDSCTPNRSYMRPISLYVDTPVECFSETADQLAVGGLNGQGGWTGNALPTEIGVVAPGMGGSGNTIQINIVDSAGNTTSTHETSCTPCMDDGIITTSVMVNIGLGSGGFGWKLFYVDTNGYSFGEWEGQGGGLVRGRIGGSGWVTGGTTLTVGQWIELKTVIDTINHTTEFVVGGTSLGVLSHNYIDLYQGARGNTLASIELVHQDRGGEVTGSAAFDNFLINSCSVTCGMSVRPDQANRLFNYRNYSGALVGDPADPLSWDFIEQNVAFQPLTFSVSEADINGAPLDYSWIGLNKTGGSIGWTESDLVTATLDTTGLPGGEYVGHLKFTDSCSPTNDYRLRSVKMMVIGDDCLIDTFSYPDANLTDEPGWRGTAGPEITVSGTTGSMVGGPTTVSTVENVPSQCPSCSTLTAPQVPGGLEDRVIITRMKVKGNPAGVAGNMFYLYFQDENGANLAWWYGGTTSISGRSGGNVTTPGILTGGWDELKAIIDVDTLQTEYFFNGQSLGTLPSGGIGFTVATVEVSRQANTELAGQVVLFDDLTVEKCRTRRDLLCEGHTPFADADSDGDVDQADFAVLQTCLTGQGVTPVPADPAYCVCFDRGSDAPGGDDDIDSFDVEAFEACASGPGIPADPNCGG